MYKNIIVIIIVFLFCACHKDVPFDIDAKVQPVLNSLFTNDSLWEITLSKSILANQQIRFLPIRNAVINIYEDGQFFAVADVFKEATDSVSIGYYTSSDENARPSSEHIYTIEANTENFSLLSATDTMGAAVVFENLELNNVFINRFFVPLDTNNIYSLQGDLSIDVKNRIGVKDYYAVKVYYWANVFQPNEIRIGENNLRDSIYKDAIDFTTSNLTGFKSYLLNDGYIFTDSLNNNDDITLHLHLDATIYRKNSPPPYLYVEVKSLSRSYYQFQKSYLEHLQTNLNPFSIPKPVFSNIQNGVGIFSAAVSSLDSVKVEQ